jgi:D-glycero-D-manno-heptose 1,7-bisphosphate phosphatase
MDKAVFLDRDGTVIRLVKNNGDLVPPRTPDQVSFCPYAVEFMKQLQDRGYLLFIISNQPDVAKEKYTHDQLFMVHKRVFNMMREKGINIRRYYYCFHHPEGTHPKYSKVCSCRKPAPGLILRAKEDNELDLDKSWMIGDKITDVECGMNAGVRSIQVHNGISLQQAYDIIIGSE